MMNYIEMPFDIKTALAHPECVYYRNGEKPDFWKYYPDNQDGYKISVVNRVGEQMYYGLYGLIFPNEKHDEDLVLHIPEKIVWISIFPEEECILSHTKKAADEYSATNRIACVEVRLTIMQYNKIINKP
jgi:hypothetical protein